MARTYTDSNGVTLVIPDSSVTINVVSQNSGLATTGIIALVGEANQGPAWTEESNLSNNLFGPGDLSSVLAKYGSGNLVDAFNGMIGASDSTRIQGSFSGAILVKTNQGSYAGKTTNDGHGTFKAELEGAVGNTIQETISTNVAEVAPTTGAFTYVPSASGSSMSVRVNGGAKQTLAISANETPASLATAITGLANLNAVGGVNTSITTGTASQGVALAVSGQNVTITLTAPATWASSAVAGSTIQIPTGSVLAGAGSANVGWYVVTASSNTAASAQISATKVTAGAPVAVTTTLSATPANDLVNYSSITINNMSGTNRNVLANLVGQTAALTVAGSVVTITLSGSNVFSASPKVGDAMYIPASSAFVGSGNANMGWYQITAVSNYATAAFITASRLSNGTPVAVSSTAVVATTDIQDYKPQIPGAGKAMEIADGGGAVNINTVMLGLGTTTAATFLGTLLTSASELSTLISLSQPSPLVSESFTQGGNISLLVGYNGTTATLTVTTVNGIKTITTAVTGGVGGSITVPLTNYNTIGALVTYLNLQPGYTAAAYSNQEALKNPSQVLDQVTSIGIASNLGNMPGEIKRDIYDMTLGLNNIAQNSVLINYSPIVKAGLPENEGPVFLTNGALGGTTSLAVSQAIEALANVTCNFIVPLFSQDASQDQLVNGTDPSSTYTIAAINAGVKSHCIAVSTAKVKKNRQAFCSILDTFANQQNAAQGAASFRVAMFFQPVIDLDAQGDIVTFQPWMAAAKAASMQSAGFYKSIFNKAINMSGIVDPTGFSNQSQSNCESAILSGLIPIQQQNDGTFLYLTDQTTYGVDNNFVYNSIQAVYVGDVIALSLALSIKQAFIGESVADVTPTVAVSFIKSKMAEFLNKKLIVGTTDYPSGWKTINVQIANGVMIVQCTVIEATSVYFAPITLNIEGFTGTASAS